MTIEEYTAQAANYRQAAIEWFAERTPMNGDRFKALIGGIEYDLEVVGICPVNRTAIGRSISEDCGAVEKGMLVHFDRNSMNLPPLR